MRSTDAKVPFELDVRDRLHASNLNLRLSNQNVVNAGGMSTMRKGVLTTPFTVNGNQVLSSQKLLQDIAVRVYIRMSSGSSNPTNGGSARRTVLKSPRTIK